MEGNEHIEPHRGLLAQPSDDQALFKVMSLENFERSLVGSYLHFNRIDSYGDFKGADEADGAQLPGDREGNAASRFIRSPSFSAADMYDKARSRSYACSFSLENSDFIWKNYGNGGKGAKIGLTVIFGPLRRMMNELFRRSTLDVNGSDFKHILYINYGLVTYVERDTYRANMAALPNPIIYSYLKDRGRFENEREMRVTLSAIGIGTFTAGGVEIGFPPHLAFPFDFRSAIESGVISSIEKLACSDEELAAVLRKINVEGKR
jgi:hypothetical protein